jgi:hypothetical protein
MGGFFSPSPSYSTTTYTPSPQETAGWAAINQQAGTIAENAIKNAGNYPASAMVAPPGSITSNWWNQANNLMPNVSGLGNTIQSYAGNSWNQQVRPGSISLPQFDTSTFQPGQLNLPKFGAVPTVRPGGGVSGLASSYAVTPQEVGASQVFAPGGVSSIGGMPQVSAPTLQNYQMGPGQTVTAPNLQSLSMRAAGNVAPSGLATTQSFTAPGVAQQFMDPYVQQVVNTQLAQAQTQEQQQLALQGSQAAQAGAFGGSRQAVEAANTSIGYQQLAANLEAQGLQNAYQQAAQQFNTQQQLGQQAQQFNIGTGLQAALANQAVQQQANLQNLSAGLQTQGLQAQTGMTAQQLNQAAGLTVGEQNLAANLGVQQLGAGNAMQAQLANQGMAFQTAAANQQAQEFGAGQFLTAEQLNQQAGLQSALANQQAGITTGLAAQQMGQQGAEFNANQFLQSGMANQAANIQAMEAQYGGGLQGALQTQQLGLSGREFGGQLALSGAMGQYGLQQQQQGLNLGAIQQAAAQEQMAGNLDLSGYATDINTLGQAAQSQQGYRQQLADAAYQQFMNRYAVPMQGLGWQSQIMAESQPGFGYTMTGTGMPAQPSMFSQIVGGALGSLGGLGSLFTGIGSLKEGGLVAKRPTGLARVRYMPKHSGPTGLAKAA